LRSASAEPGGHTNDEPWIADGTGTATMMAAAGADACGIPKRSIGGCSTRVVPRADIEDVSREMARKISQIP